MSLLKEFKEFALKGNVFDMAVGVIIGAGFGKIAGSFTNDLMMPPLGLLLGKVDFKDLKITLQAASADGATPAVTLNYGMFIQYTFDFIILAFAVFLLVKGYNALKKTEPAPPPPAPPAPSKEEVLLTEIRDLLKNK